MKYIKKRVEPQELGYWKAKAKQQSVGVNYDYQNLPDPPKGIVQDSLMREQGYICCYCCQRIATDTSHIEHLDPQNPALKNESDPDLSLDYKNMLASCGSDKHWPKHCGNKKGNQAIEVSPIQPNCEDFFSYTGSGEIRPQANNTVQQVQAAQQTIEILGLNDYDLKEGRAQALEFLRSQFPQGLTTTQVSKRAEKIRNLDAQEKYQPFWPAVSHYLKKYYKV